jgi:peptidoglycan hydrolase CwlO-like protein
MGLQSIRTKMVRMLSRCYNHLMRLFSAVFLLTLVCFPGITLAQASATSSGGLKDPQKAALQAQLDAINTQIKQNQAGLTQLQTQRTSLERDVDILDSKIKAAQLGIKARDLTILQLKGGIHEQELGIRVLDSKVASGQQSIAQMLRETRVIDDQSLAQIALAGNLQDLMHEVDDFQTIHRALGKSFDLMKDARKDLLSRKAALEDQQSEEQELKQLQVLQQKQLKETEKQKSDLVAAAKGQESIYQKIIAGQRATAAQIEAQLFDLRDTTKSVTFGDMYVYAKQASAITNVRPAVILGILKEETNLGQNLGSGNWKLDMHPTRDQPVFIKIMQELGLDPDKQPVSKKQNYGWGGAMGPAQFIPSTWVMYKDRIAAATGQNPPNPWDPRTAVFATAILMADNGADAQTFAAERLAALRYLAGWKNATKAAYAFYGDEVMEYAAEFQAQINVLGN